MLPQVLQALGEFLGGECPVRSRRQKRLLPDGWSLNEQ
jgi:hypothetical protein